MFTLNCNKLAIPKIWLDSFDTPHGWGFAALDALDPQDLGVPSWPRTPPLFPLSLPLPTPQARLAHCASPRKLKGRALSPTLQFSPSLPSPLRGGAGGGVNVLLIVRDAHHRAVQHRANYAPVCRKRKDGRLSHPFFFGSALPSPLGRGRGSPCVLVAGKGDAGSTRPWPRTPRCFHFPCSAQLCARDSHLAPAPRKLRGGRRSP